MIDINKLALDEFLDSKPQQASNLKFVEQSSSSVTQVAIIGMAGSVGAAGNLEEFWNMVSQGEIGRRQLPQPRRQDFEDYLRLRGHFHKVSEEDYLQETFLEEIDKFDHRFFGLSRQEANLMDPNQRLFLQTAWSALENAGYGGQSIQGSSTGVFVGHSADFGQDYRHIIQTFSPDAPEISVAGNIKSIIASRIAYQLDLRGPSMLIDTACSSGLVSVHQACRSLRNGECEMAIAGAVKIDLLPIEDRGNTGVGTRDIQDTIARDGRTKTFDDNCDGTSAAEGVFAFVLKPLQKAIDDGDHIHAVIAGSSVNQDGLSVGITAPNSAAQEGLIIAALEDAGIAAEDVGYIEAHGTATRLGDPIEVNGIQRAFSHHTRRKQFCAIGSVKSNIGHMDNAAGLAGLAKVIGALNHAQLPPSLHFHCPNQNIAFEHSPVFVNDRLCEWPVNRHGQRIAGINSFGLSGTNCHLLVSNAPPIGEDLSESEISPALFLLSAKSDEQLKQYAKDCLQWLSAAKNAGWRLSDICFTLATGRLHHNHRLAMVVHSREQLISLLERLTAGEVDENIHISHFRVTPQASDAKGELSESQQLALGKEAEALVTLSTHSSEQLAKLRELYSRGAVVNWIRIFPKQLKYRRAPLPGYPFARQRCWVEISELAKKRQVLAAVEKRYAHPLLDNCIATSRGLQLYKTAFSSSRHWELSEHRVRGMCILPGTAYLEFILAIVHEKHPQVMPRDADWEICFERLQFMTAFAVSADETRDLQVQLLGEYPRYQISLVSSDAGDWQVHAEASLSLGDMRRRTKSSIQTLKQRLTDKITFTKSDDQRRGLEIGDRWNSAFLDGWYSQESGEFLVKLALPKPYQSELSKYHYHPALMDVAVNAVNHLLVEDQLFLPFSYRNFSLFSALPERIHVYLKLKQQSTELANFNVQILDDAGNVVSEIEDYAVKRVAQTPLTSTVRQRAYETRLVAMKQPVSLDAPLPERLLFILDKHSSELPLLQALIKKSDKSASILLDQSSQERSGQLLTEFSRQGPINGVIFAGSLAVSDKPEAMVEAIYQMGSWFKELMQQKISLNGPCVVLTCQAQMTEEDATIQPAQSAILDFVRVAALENPQLKLLPVDLDVADLRSSDIKRIAALWNQVASDNTQLCLRNGQVFIEQLQDHDLAGSNQFSLRSGGVYLISGGTGSLGLEVARSFAMDAKDCDFADPIKLILVGTQSLSSPDEWEKLARKGDTNKRKKLYQTLLDIGAAGVTVETLAYDLADESAVKRLLRHIRNQYGELHGVIHAAGKAGAGFIVNKSREQLAEVMLAKTAGAWWLHQHTQKDQLDFFVLYSSIATVLRNAGQSDYTAANRFLDALAQKRRKQGLPAMSVRWPAWRETGIAVEYNAVDESEFFTPINTDDGLNRLRAAMANASLPEVIVLADINSRATRQDIVAAGLLASDSVHRLVSAHEAVHANTSGVDNTEQTVTLKGVTEPDESQLAVAKLWRKVLGATVIAIDDHFMDLGGNSILTTQLYNEYEKLHPGAMDMADLFSHTTIGAQASQLNKALGLSTGIEKEEETDQDIDDILQRLSRGDLSAEEAGAML